MTATKARTDEAELRIEPFDPSDLDELMEIEVRSFTLPWSRESYEELWPLDTIRIWMVRRGSELVGYYLVQAVGEERELHVIAVKPEHRREGVGRFMLDHLIAEARAQAAENIYLQVRPSNAAARALYGRYGFQPVGVRRAYYRDNSEDAIVMRLAIE